MLWHPPAPSHTDLLFITLRKREALFSPIIRYRDLALGPRLFHGESQSTTMTESGDSLVAAKGDSGSYDPGLEVAV